MNKKIIVLSVASLLTSTALSDVRLYKTDSGFTVDVGAELMFEAGSRAQKKAQLPISANNDNIGFNSNAAVHLSVQKEHQADWKSGLQIGMAANEESSSPVGAHYLDRTYLWTEHAKFGRAEAGSNVSAANEMIIKADAGGGWESYTSLNNNTGIASSNFLTSAKLVLKEKDFETFGSHERSRKITYYTPKYNGFQYGISYIPDVTNNGSAIDMPNLNPSDRRESNAVATGLTWEKAIASKQSVEVALVGEVARVERSPVDKANHRSYHNSTAVSIGGIYTYDKLAFTTSYGNHWATQIQKIPAHIPYIYFITLGASYKVTEKTKLDSSVLFSEKYNNPMIVGAISAEYKLAPGLMPYANIVYFNMRQKNTYVSPSTTTGGTSTISSLKDHNDGVVFILGTKLKF